MKRSDPTQTHRPCIPQQDCWQAPPCSSLRTTGQDVSAENRRDKGIFPIPETGKSESGFIPGAGKTDPVKQTLEKLGTKAKTTVACIRKVSCIFCGKHYNKNTKSLQSFGEAAHPRPTYAWQAVPKAGAYPWKNHRRMSTFALYTGRRPQI